LESHTPFDILLSPWCFQTLASSPIRDTELYAVQLLPLHCLNCILNESFWEREDSSCHINFVLLKYAKEKDVANTLFCMGNVFLRAHTDYQNALECFLEAVLMLENVVGLSSVAFKIDEAKCLGGIEPYHISMIPNLKN